MHTKTIVPLLGSCLVLMIGCSDDKAEPKNPADAASEFSNPSGTIAEGDADTVVNEALQASGSTNLVGEATSVFGIGASLRTAQTTDDDINLSQIQSCIDGDQSSGTIDFACFGDLLGCTGSGSATFTSDGTNFTSELKDFGLNCGDDDADFTCNGSVSSSFSDNIAVVCNNVNCTVDGVSGPVGSNACFAGSSILVDADSGSVVCVQLAVNDGCTKLCSEWEDSDGELTISCDVTELFGGACEDDGGSVTKANNCVISRDVTSCASVFDQ